MQSRLARFTSGQRTWIVVWTLWGAAISGLIAIIDGGSFTALLWLLAGILLGALAGAPYDSLLSRVFTWYERWGNAWDMPEPDDIRSPEFVARLQVWREHTAQLADLDDDEREVLAQHLAHDVRPSMLGALLPLPPMLGVLWGTFLGPFIGILAKFDPRFEMSAGYGAVAGLSGMIGLLIFAVTLILTVLISFQDPSIQPRSRWRMLLAPLLAIAFVMHCLRTGWRAPTTATDE